MPGITRIHIDSEWSRSDDWRLKLASDHEPVADLIYQTEFARLGLDLAPGVKVVTANKEEAAARYDWSEGIDVIPVSTRGARMTLQEKFLTFDESTATFEETKTSGAPGAWYYCTAQYYFVGYTRHYWNWRTREIYSKAVIGFQDWILLDFPALRRADAANSIQWEYSQNTRDQRRATFRFINFDKLPATCIVARHKGNAPEGWPWTKWVGDRGPGPCPKCTARDYYPHPKTKGYVCRNCHTLYSTTPVI